MAATYQIIALSSLDPDGRDRKDEPELLYPEALRAAEALKFQGKAFRVHASDGAPDEEIRALNALGGI